MGGLDQFVGAGVSAYPVWIRLAKKGNAFSAWYRNKADAAWTVIAQGITPLGAPASSQVALISLSHNADMDGKTVFDDFTCLQNGSTAIRSVIAHWIRASGAGLSGLPGVPSVNAQGRLLPRKSVGADFRFEDRSEDRLP